MQVAGAYLSNTSHGLSWSNVTCEYDAKHKLLKKVQGSKVAVSCHFVHPRAEFMVFELAPPDDVTGWQARVVQLPPVITCALVTTPCVVLRVGLHVVTAADVMAVCAVPPAGALVQRRYQLQVQSVCSSAQWMLQQPKQPKEWGEKKANSRKPSSQPKKRRVRAAEVLEEDDDVLEDVVEDVEDEGEADSDEDVEDVVDDGEEDDVDEACDEGGDDAEELELEDEEDEEEEEVDDAVDANSTEEEADEAEEAQSKRPVKKSRRG